MMTTIPYINRLAAVTSRLVIGLLLAAETVHAQAPTLTSLSPVRNALAVPRTMALVAGFSQPLSSSSVQGVRVFSTRRGGKLAGTTTISGSTLQFTPAQSLQAGETVSATLTDAVRNVNEVSLAKPQIVQFTTATTPSAGMFTVGSDPSVAAAPFAVAVGDVNGDGWPDLITHNFSNRLSIRLNSGTGTFSGGPDVSVPNGSDLAVGDIDNDGDLDMVVENSSYIVTGPPAGTALLVRNNGAAGFSTTSLAFAGATSGVALGDVNGDGYVDLVAALTGNNTGLRIRLNDQQGNFITERVAYAGGGRVTLGDLDNDGDLDIVSAERDLLGQISTLLNDGTGIFSLRENLPMSSNPLQVRLGDLDGDGDLDLVAGVVATPGILNLYRNDGSAHFTLSGTVPITNGAQEVALGDIDGDGDLDLASVGFNTTSSVGTVSVRLNSGAGTFSGTQEVRVGDRPYGVALADVDGNGTLDLLTANAVSNSVSVRLNSQVLATRSAFASRALQVYPNPTHEQVQLELPAAFRGQVVHVRLCNALGQVVREQPLNPAAPQLSVAGLVAGLYTVQVRTSQQQASTRLLVE